MPRPSVPGGQPRSPVTVVLWIDPLCTILDGHRVFVQGGNHLIAVSLPAHRHSCDRMCTTRSKFNQQSVHKLKCDVAVSSTNTNLCHRIGGRTGSATQLGRHVDGVGFAPSPCRASIFVRGPKAWLRAFVGNVNRVLDQNIDFEGRFLESGVFYPV